MWKTWKKSFDTWEAATADFLEQALQNRAVLEPAGHALTGAMKLKAAGDRATAAWWGAVGLPTKRDQERSLHSLNELHSRILDLEDRLVELEHQLPAASSTKRPRAPRKGASKG